VVYLWSVDLCVAVEKHAGKAVEHTPQTDHRPHAQATRSSSTFESFGHTIEDLKLAIERDAGQKAAATIADARVRL
jgi:hypothetical protein